MMVKFVCGLILGMLLVALPANAQQVASMEIHVQDGDHVSVYECWPALASDANRTVTVYFNFSNGTAVYTCYLTQQYDIVPVPSPDQYNSRA